MQFGPLRGTNAGVKNLVSTRFFTLMTHAQPDTCGFRIWLWNVNARRRPRAFLQRGIGEEISEACDALRHRKNVPYSLHK